MEVELNLHNLLMITVISVTGSILLNILAKTVVNRGIPVVSKLASALQSAEQLGSGA